MCVSGYCLCGPSAKMCWGKCRRKFPKLTKQMVKIYISCFLSMFSCAFAITMMFPFLPFMVEFLLPWLLENEALVGTYAGIVASSMFLGRMFGSYIWGTLADRKGRRPVVIVSLVLVGVTSAIFGLSVTFEMAVFLRFLVGFTNGVIGTSKAVISEASDDSNQAFGVSLVGTAWGMGIIVGPAVSGALSDPIGQYNLTIDNYVAREFLTRFPYSLPCLVNLALCVLAAVVAFFLLPETLGMKKNRKRSEISQRDIELVLSEVRGDSMSTNSDDSERNSLEMDDNSIDESESALLINNSEHLINEHSHTNVYISNPVLSTVVDPELKQNQAEDNITTTHDNEITSHDDNEAEKDSTETKEKELSGDESPLDEENSKPVVVAKRRQSWSEIQAKKAKTSMKDSIVNLLSFLCDRTVLLSVMVYSIFSFAVIGYNEIFSVWAKTSQHLGGLGFTLAEIGIALTVSGVLFLPFSLLLYPVLEKRFGSINSFYVISIILIPSTMLFPNIHYVNEKWLLWVLVCLLLVLCQMCITVAFSCQVLFINNSVTFDKLGSVNGLAMTITSLSRTLAPLVSGGLFSLSLSETAATIGYPFDYRLVFTIFGLTYLLCVLLAACLPISINKQKIIEDVE